MHKKEPGVIERTFEAIDKYPCRAIAATLSIGVAIAALKLAVFG